MGSASRPNHVVQLEEELAERLGASCALATGYGRGAVLLAARVVRSTSAACEVLVPSFICAQVPEAVRRAGARVRFYSVPRDLEIRSELLAARVTGNTKAAIVPHYFGHAQPRIAELAETCRTLGIAMIEDCAQALGAGTEDGRAAGSLGDLAIFSFTKADWGYGGGALVFGGPRWMESAREVRRAEFVQANRRAFAYGLLRRADFLANRPTRTRGAERAGRWLQRLFGLGETNFYDAGLFEALMPEFAARRARQVLRQLDSSIRRRYALQAKLVAMMQSKGIPLLGEPASKTAGNGSFILLVCPQGYAEEWIALADKKGITLRRTWPAYQEVEQEQQDAKLEWLAERVLVMEIHPDLEPREVSRIVDKIAELSKRTESKRCD